jgi:hypothetical protein
MGNFTEQDLAGLELCPHGERRKFCLTCEANAFLDSKAKGEVPESLIEAECTKLLEQDNWRALRTDPVSDRGRGKGFGELGMADHLYIRYDNPFRGRGTRAYCEVLWIEFKRPGKKPAKHQQDWHIKERARGALTLIAGEDFPASVDGFRAWYADSGLKRATLDKRP